MKLGSGGSFRFLKKALQNIGGPSNDIDHECESSRVGDDRRSDLATHRDHQLRTTSKPQLLAELATLAMSETKIDRLKIFRAPLDREAMIDLTLTDQSDHWLESVMRMAAKKACSITRVRVERLRCPLADESFDAVAMSGDSLARPNDMNQPLSMLVEAGPCL